MMGELERYQRQLGLLHQPRVQHLKVLLLGDGPALPYVATNLALLGVGALLVPLASPRLTAAHLAGQFLFRTLDLGTALDEALARRVHELNPQVQTQSVAPAANLACDVIIVTAGEPAFDLPASVPIIWADVTEYGVHIGTRRPQFAAYTPNLLTPALASLCGALAAQEALRVTRCVRSIAIQKFWVTLNYALGEPANTELQFALEGASLAATSESRDGAGPTYHVSVNLHHRLARRLFEAATITEPLTEMGLAPTESLYYSPFWDNRLVNNCVIEQPITLPALDDRRVVLGGIGGLGTWVAALLAASNFRGKLVVFDSDTRIESHNLNRQVLYTDDVLNEPKVHAAARALAQINPALAVTALLEEIQATTAITHAELMAQADLALCAFDNFHARYVLSEWAALHNVPLVNGGTDGLNGDVEVIVPAKHGCLFCRWEQTRGYAKAEAMSANEEHLSCTHADANVPDVGTALVTTTAAIASWQTLLALLTLANPAMPVDHQLGYWGRENALEKCRLAEPCPVHAKGVCAHPHEFWHRLEELEGEPQ